ncbi:hypothetical protein WJX81_001365 [Elliptochloris bilobata]|uniref:Uncharacterized protein n=1 Tax=Elliptochloris bilobata TaxID=381761 RepID=A0AAW1QLX1_9CHLO
MVSVDALGRPQAQPAVAQRAAQSALGASAAAGGGVGASGSSKEWTGLGTSLADVVGLRALRAGLQGAPGRSGGGFVPQWGPQWDPRADPCAASDCDRGQCNWEGITCRRWRVTALQLDPVRGPVRGAAQSAGIMAPEIGQLTGLQALELPGLGIAGPLPASIGNLTSLTTLVLRGNCLTSTLPPEWGALAALAQLDLSGNQLVGRLPLRWFTMSSLRSLNVSGNAGLCAWPQMWRAAAVQWDHTLPRTCAGGASDRLARSGVGLPSADAAAPAVPTSPPSDTSGLQGTLRVTNCVNIAVSLIIASCLLLGIAAGVVRSRRRRLAQQAFMHARESAEAAAAALLARAIAEQAGEDCRAGRRGGDPGGDPSGNSRSSRAPPPGLTPDAPARLDDALAHALAEATLRRAHERLAGRMPRLPMYSTAAADAAPAAAVLGASAEAPRTAQPPGDIMGG